MTRIPPIDLDPVMLAARVAKALSYSHRLAFAQLAPDLTLLQHSPNFLVLLEATTDWQIVGQSVVDLLAEFVGAEQILQRVLGGDLQVYTLEFVNRIQPDESIVYLNFQVTPLDDLQPERGLLLIVEDVTEFGRLQQNLTQDRNELLLLQQQLAQTNEELNRSNQLKSLILSMAAHDLRSPLSVINGYADLVQRLIPEEDPSKMRRYMVTIESQSRRMNRLVSDLLDLDLIERGELRLTVRMCDFVNLVREVIEVEKHNFRDREIEIRLPHLPINLMIDNEKMTRVVHNLISNACKYTPESERITVLIAHTQEEAVLQVMDNGQGMNATQMANLFQPYYRTEDARESQIEGRGLGLYIVKMLVEAHHGHVEVESAPGRGSTFTVYLPLETNA